MAFSTREPLIIRGAIVAAVTAVIHVGVVLGLLQLDAASEAAIGGAIDLLGTAVLVVWSRGAVTPVADPTLPEGTVITVEETGEPKHLAE
jgi:hypothetical protein